MDHDVLGDIQKTFWTPGLSGLLSLSDAVLYAANGERVMVDGELALSFSLKGHPYTQWTAIILFRSVCQ